MQQHGVIGRYLASMHLYVEYFGHYHKTRDQPECGKKGAYEVDGKCYILRRIEDCPRRDAGEKWRPRLEDEYLDAMEKYGVDLKKFIKNIIDCNNKEAEEDVQFDDDYPKCFFGMPFAIYADVSTPIALRVFFPRILSTPCTNMLLLGFLELRNVGSSQRSRFQRMLRTVPPMG